MQVSRRHLALMAIYRCLKVLIEHNRSILALQCHRRSLVVILFQFIQEVLPIPH